MTLADVARDESVAAIDVLIVEDDDVDRERARRMIARHAPGMTVTEAASGREMIELLSTCRFDAILLDFHLEDCTAADLLPTLLSPGGPRCPVIILTGHGDENLAVWALQHGAHGYLGKAKLTAPRLLDTLETAVVRWRREDGAPNGVDAESLDVPSDEVRFRTTTDGVILWISDSVGPMLGWNPAELVGTRLDRRIHPDDPPLPARHDAETRRWIHRLRHLDGAWPWMETTYRVATDAASGLDELRGVSRNVTERVDAEHQLAENEARYRRLVNLTGEAVLACDSDDTIVFVNPALAAMAERSVAELVGVRFEDLVHPEDCATFQRRRSVRQDGRTDAYEIRLCGAEGRAVWVVVNAAEMFEFGRSTGWVARLTDISARREAEQNLAATELRYQAWHEMSPIGLFRANSHGDIVYVNSKWREIVGWPLDREEVPTWCAIIHPDDFEVAMRRLRHGLETGADFDEDFRLLTPGQRVRWVTVRSVPIGVTDQMTDGRLGTMEDVSERRAVQEALRRSEELYRSVIETMTEGVVIETAQGVLVEANRAARTLVGNTSGDLREVTVIREDGSVLPPHEHPIAIALRTAAPCNGVSLGIRDEPRGERWLNVSAQPLWRDDDGPPWAAVCTFSDVTARRKVDQLKNEFISVVSHEMRTPLTSIKASLGLISAGATGLLGEITQRMVDIALKNTDWIIRLVNDMLDLERIESGRSESVRAEADLAELVAIGVSTMRQRADREGVRVVNEVGSNEMAVVVHSDRIVQTVTNLLSNAIKFSTRGGVIRVTMSDRIDRDGSEGSDVVAVRLIDNGRGVPPERAGDIFERFHQVDASDSRDKGGTGLGLAICKTIVEEHGGRIWVEETPGGGATFVFTLPVSAPEGATPRGHELDLPGRR